LIVIAELNMTHEISYSCTRTVLLLSEENLRASDAAQSEL